MERPEFEGKEGSKVIVEGMGAGTLMFYGLHHVRTTRCVRCHSPYNVIDWCRLQKNIGKKKGSALLRSKTADN